MHDVAILYYVVLALDMEQAGLAYSGFRLIFDVVLILDDLCADETFLEVGVDDTGTLWGFPSFMVGPGLHLHLTGGDKGLEVQQMICLFNKSVDTTLLESELVKEHLLVLVGVQRCDVLLGLGGDDHSLGLWPSLAAISSIFLE